MDGFIDLHVHCIPGVDDGPKTIQESVALIRGLTDLGFDTLVATPHVRPPRWDQKRQTLLQLRDELVQNLGPNAPLIEIAAEHYFDDEVWRRFENDQLILYPGGKAALFEFGNDRNDLPIAFEHRFFDITVRGIRPVIAHPERQLGLAQDLDRLEKLMRSGVLTVISISSLGLSRLSPLRIRTEKIIRAGLASMAASDAHSADELVLIKKGIKRLEKLVSKEGVHRMMRVIPSSILSICL